MLATIRRDLGSPRQKRLMITAVVALLGIYVSPTQAEVLKLMPILRCGAAELLPG